MPRLSEKYIAGFLDADGHIGLQYPKDCRRPQLFISFSQKASHDEVLRAVHDQEGGGLSQREVKGKAYTKLILCGKTARKLLVRIRKHLVIKQVQADRAMEFANEPYSDFQDVKDAMKQARRANRTMPNFPPRKWLAGYFDGDGCVSVARLTEYGNACLVAHIACADYDEPVLALLQKAFGGKLHKMRNTNRQWVLAMPASKAKQFLGYFCKHSVVKRDQLLFILGCAAMGHYRDGRNIKSALKHLKAQEQRLSDSEVDTLIRSIEDLPPRKRTDYGEFVRDEQGRIVGKSA